MIKIRDALFIYGIFIYYLLFFYVHQVDGNYFNNSRWVVKRTKTNIRLYYWLGIPFTYNTIANPHMSWWCIHVPRIFFVRKTSSFLSLSLIKNTFFNTITTVQHNKKKINLRNNFLRTLYSYTNYCSIISSHDSIITSQ